MLGGVSDTIVVGAGPAGAALSLALRRRGFRVWLLERGRTDERRVGETLPGVARAILSELGLWSDFERQQHRPAYALRSIWGQSTPIERSSVFQRHGPGFHLDRVAFDAWLLDRAVAAGTVLIEPAEIRSVVRHGKSHWRLGYRIRGSESVAEAPVLVDATGSSAWVARQVGAQSLRAQRMVGVARWFERDGIEPVTLVETAPEGYFYSAPLPGAELVVVWITASKSPTANAGHDDAVWQQCIGSAPATAGRVRGARAVGRPVVRSTGPALTRWSDIDGFLPVGDAACSFDPISGEGLCFALRSALDAARAIEDVAAGESSTLDRYRRGVEQVFRAHLAYRQRAYRAERRFEASEFWRSQDDPVGL
jgi:flavin-dependent dehydrogenase